MRASENLPGFELPLLLLAGFRTLIDELHARLAAEGHPGLRPATGFAMQAIGPRGATATEIAARLGVTKQAAGKTIDGLERVGYARREADPADGRRKLVVLTDRGRDALARSAQIFDDLRDEWAAQLGTERLQRLANDLRAVTPGGVGTDMTGWFAD